MKNCEPCEFGCDVRAIASVAALVRALHRLVLDRVAGPALTDARGIHGGTRPNSPSPPWITKPGTSRWKTTPLYQPHSASATKLPAALGPSEPSTLSTIGPWLVSIVTVRVWPAGSGGGALVGQVRSGAGAAVTAQRSARPSVRQSPSAWTVGERSARPTRAGAARDEREDHDQAATSPGESARNVHAAASTAAGIVDGTGEQWLSQDDAVDAGVAEGADPVEIGDSPGHEDVGVDGADDSGEELGHPTRRRRARARSDGRRDPQGSRSVDSRVGRVARPATGNAAIRSGRGSRPTASQSPATATHSRTRSACSATLIASTTRVAPAANARRIWSAPSRPPATWIGMATRDATRPIASRLPGRARSRPVEVDEVHDARALRDANCSAMTSGRSVGAPTPAAAPGQ